MLSAAAQRPSIWTGWRPATCMPDHCFCEAVRDQLVRQPANAVSGLAFVAVALMLLPNAAAFDGRRVFAVLFALASIMVGLGSVLYHASLTFWGQTADLLGMYLLVTLLMLFNVARIIPVSSAVVTILYVFGNAALLAGLVLFPAARRYTFAFLVLATVALEVGARRRDTARFNGRLFAGALLALAVGFAIWIADITRVLCAPNSWVQGHAVWHLAGALAVWLVFACYASAQPTGGRLQ